MKINCSRLTEIFFITLFSVTPLIFIPNSLEFHFIAKTSFFYFILSLLIALSIFRFLHGEKNIYRTPLDILFLFFAFLIFLSSFQSTNQYESVETIKFFMSFIIFYYITSFFFPIEKFKKVISYAIHTAFAVSLIALFQGFLSKGFTLQETVTSTFGHSNILAQYLIAVFPFSFCRNLETRRHYAILYLFETPVIFAAIMLTYCRGAWLGLGISIIFIFFLSLKHSAFLGKTYSIKFLFIICTGLLLISVPIILKNPGVVTSLIPEKKIETRFSEEKTEYAEVSKVKTIKQRKEIWKETAKIVWQKPFLGVGAGNFKIQIPRYMKIKDGSSERNIAKWAHNDFLEIASESGIIASIIFLWIIIRVFLRLFSDKSFSNEQKIFVIPLASSSAATFVQSQTSFNLHQTVPALFLFFSIAVIMNGDKMISVKINKSEKVKLGTIFFFILFSASSLLFFIRQPLAEIYYVRASKTLQESDWKESKLNIDKCLEFNSGEGKYFYSAALISFGLSDFNSALEYSLKAKELTPNVTELLKLYIFSLNECGNRSYSEGKIEKALKYYSDSTAAFDELFELPLTKNEKSNLKNLASVAYYNFGNALKNKGDFKDARAAFKTSLVFNPDYLPSLQKINENLEYR